MLKVLPYAWSLYSRVLYKFSWTLHSTSYWLRLFKIEQSSRRKGVGIYAGNWEYVTDEEKEPEYLSVVQKTAEFEGRTTRRAYAKITSKNGAGDSDNIVGLSSGKQMRKSGRARNAVDYTRLSGSESSARGIATPEQGEENDIPPAQETERTSPSKSTLTSSALMPDHLSSSTSTSAAMYAERPERPKLSWNAIVYEVLAIAETSMKFPQLVQAVKDRYPFFNSSSQEKVLESGVKNPLYFHEAFCKGEMMDGKQTWGLKPGEFIDKKTGEVLTPRPRHTISSPSPSINEQLHEMEDQSPIDLASNVAHINNPPSSQPRFGREILNSPEIPDSQDAKAITPSPQRRDCLTATEHPPHLEEATGSQELADAADSTSVIAFVETNLKSQSPQPSFQWATPTFSPINTVSNSKYPTAAGTKIQSVQIVLGATGHEAPASAAQLLSIPQTAQGWTSSISSSTGESESGSSPTTTQAVSTSVPLVHAVSPTPAHNLFVDCAAASETPYVNSTKSTPSVTEVACTQL